MINKVSISMALLSICFIASNAFSTTTTWDTSGTPGSSVVIEVDGAATGLIPGAEDISFTPSAKVIMSGASETTAFAVNSGHEAVRGKEAGQNYGMASDSSTIFWLKADATFPALTANDTNSAAFTSWNES